jgi:hypothetical protein
MPGSQLHDVEALTGLMLLQCSSSTELRPLLPSSKHLIVVRHELELYDKLAGKHQAKHTHQGEGSFFVGPQLHFEGPRPQLLAGYALIYLPPWPIPDLRLTSAHLLYLLLPHNVLPQLIQARLHNHGTAQQLESSMPDGNRHLGPNIETLRTAVQVCAWAGELVAGELTRFPSTLTRFFFNFSKRSTAVSFFFSSGVIFASFSAASSLQ